MYITSLDTSLPARILPRWPRGNIGLMVRNENIHENPLNKNQRA